jgi:hypothetical protein
LFNFFSRLRLVMPPVLFMTLSFPMTQLAHVLFPTAMANGTISGSFVFCERNWFLFYFVLHSHPGCRCYLWYNALRVCRIFIFW